MTEIFKTIPGFKGRYKASKRGQILSCAPQKGERIISQRPNKDGYYTVTIGTKGRRKALRVYRAVAETYIPNPENKPEINHIDGNKTNNNVSNLEWCTHKENVMHAIATGLFCDGEDHRDAKLTVNDILEIRWLHTLGYNCAEIGRDYGFGRKHIWNIVNYKKWKNVA